MFRHRAGLSSDIPRFSKVDPPRGHPAFRIEHLRRRAPRRQRHERCKSYVIITATKPTKCLHLPLSRLKGIWLKKAPRNYQMMRLEYRAPASEPHEPPSQGTRGAAA
ncbi:hypothetical protein PUN4_720065 [Paraburkholderia unamae]|nr:hypothetical protein PUN4_720065 [Paraburkholderia unamae]